MRVLVASTAGAGHYGPLVPFVEALVRRGDEVLLVVPPGLAATVADAGYPFRVGAEPPADELATLWERFSAVSATEAAVIANREIFGRLGTAAMLPVMEDVYAEWRPDLVLREPCEYASAVAAERYSIPHAQVAISLAEVEASCLALAAPVLEPHSTGIVDRIHESAYVTRFPDSLDPSPFPTTLRYRETAKAPSDPLPDWWSGSEAPLIYVTFGTVAAALPVAGTAYRAALDGVAGLPARVLLTVGRATDLGALGPIPANVHVERWVAQDDVLPDASVVVCHGGSGTTFGALAAGVPLVVVPLFADQPVNARLVAAAGAGVVVDPDPDRIRDALEQVLADPSYRQAAHRLATEMRELPTIDDALVGVVERKMRHSTRSAPQAPATGDSAQPPR